MEAVFNYTNSGMITIAGMADFRHGMKVLSDYLTDYRAF